MTKLTFVFLGLAVGAALGAFSGYLFLGIAVGSSVGVLLSICSARGR